MVASSLVSLLDHPCWAWPATMLLVPPSSAVERPTRRGTEASCLQLHEQVFLSGDPPAVDQLLAIDSPDQYLRYNLFGANTTSPGCF